MSRGSNLRRRIKRAQLSVNRKSTVSRWMNAVTVRVNVIKMKARERAEKSCRPRRRRRGQRGGKKRRSREGKSRSSVSTPRPSKSKTSSSRKVNHSGRKFIWALKAATAFANRKVVQQVAKELSIIAAGGPNQIGVRNEQRLVDPRAWAAAHRHYDNLVRKARYCHLPSVVAFDGSLYEFLAMRFGGVEDLAELLEISDLPRRRPYESDRERTFAPIVTSGVVVRGVRVGINYPKGRYSTSRGSRRK